MDDTEQSPEPPVKSRRYPSLSQMWIGVSGLFGLVLDAFRFGGNRYGEIPSAGTLTFVMFLTLLIGYYAWKSSENRFRDAIIVLFAIAAYSEALQEATDGSNKVGIPDLVFDIIWVVVAFGLYTRTDNKQ